MGTEWCLPFDLTRSTHRSRWRKLLTRLKGEGTCSQGIDGKFSHFGSLRYAYDFDLPSGTPVRASKAGWVAVACGAFTEGGLRVELKARANYVAIRHEGDIFSRYYHLQSTAVVDGEFVAAGAVIGYSGNTGYSGMPHLHFDVVDVLPVETATFALVCNQKVCTLQQHVVLLGPGVLYSTPRQCRAQATMSKAGQYAEALCVCTVFAGFYRRLAPSSFAMLGSRLQWRLARHTLACAANRRTPSNWK